MGALVEASTRGGDERAADKEEGVADKEEGVADKEDLGVAMVTEEVPD